MTRVNIAQTQEDYPVNELPPFPLGDLDSLFIMPEFDESQLASQMVDAYERSKTNPNAFSNWFHAVENAGVRHPKTQVLAISPEIQAQILDNKPLATENQVEMDALVASVQAFGEQHGFPIFWKTSFSSAKHFWNQACALPNGEPETVMNHLAELLTFQCMNGIETFTPELILREMIKVNPVFTAFEGQMPVTEEYRVFARNGTIEGFQPYWPVESIKDPSSEGWESALATISTPTDRDIDFMTKASERITRALKGYWSVDFLKDKDGQLWLIDMAEGDRSYRNEAGFKVIKKPESGLSL